MSLIYLASGSPRRRELVQLLGYSFEILRPEVEENGKKGSRLKPMCSAWREINHEQVWLLHPRITLFLAQIR